MYIQEKAAIEKHTKPQRLQGTELKGKLLVKMITIIKVIHQLTCLINPT